MPDPAPPFFDLLREWNNFYFMIGGAAATLIGLIFVAVSLGANLVSAERQTDIDTFVTPNLLYFISVLAVSCVMLIPTPSSTLIAAAVGLMGWAGVAHVLWVMARMARPAQSGSISKSHWLWHVLLPLVGYALISGAAGRLGVSRDAGALLEPSMSRETEALLALGFAIMLLLISAIWRAWELVLWIARQRSGKE